MLMVMVGPAFEIWRHGWSKALCVAGTPMECRALKTGWRLGRENRLFF